MEIVYLFILFFIKHFLADYPFQTEYMLRKSSPIYGWKIPLATHCLVHAGLTYAVLLSVVSLGMFHITWGAILGLVLLEFILHFIIDAWKARLCTSKPTETAFWVALGTDQLFHYLTYALIVALII